MKGDKKISPLTTDSADPQKAALAKYSGPVESEAKEEQEEEEGIVADLRILVSLSPRRRVMTTMMM